MRARWPVLAALTAALSACASTTGAPPDAMVDVGPTLEFGVAVARTAEEQRQGLSGGDVSEGTGMLFVFDDATQRQVWMAGMRQSLDIAWIVEDQVLAVNTLDPCTRTDQETCPQWTSPDPVDALLEVPAGALDGIEPGTAVAIREEPR